MMKLIDVFINFTIFDMFNVLINTSMQANLSTKSMFKIQLSQIATTSLFTSLKIVISNEIIVFDDFFVYNRLFTMIETYFEI